MVQRKIGGVGKLGSRETASPAWAPAWQACLSSSARRQPRGSASARGLAGSELQEEGPARTAGPRGHGISLSNKKYIKGCLGVSDTGECAHQGPGPHPEDLGRALKSLSTPDAVSCPPQAGLAQPSQLSLSSRRPGGKSEPPGPSRLVSHQKYMLHKGRS